MEETVWIAIGIISVLIAFGIIAGFFQRSSEEDKLAYAEESVKILGQMCNKVCLMPDQTYLYVDATIPSGTIITANDNSICIEIEDELYCSRCQCRISDYSLDLNTPEAKKLFKVHNYKCFFLNDKRRISMECKG